MKKGKSFLFGILLGAIFIIGGIVTFFVIKATTPNYVVIKNNVDVTTTYKKIDDKNIETLGQDVFYFEDILDVKDVNSFELNTSKISNLNSSYKNFLVSFSFECSGETADFSFSTDAKLKISEKEQVIKSTAISGKKVSVNDFKFSYDINKIYKFSIENGDTKCQIEYKTLKMLVLGEK